MAKRWRKGTAPCSVEQQSSPFCNKMTSSHTDIQKSVFLGCCLSIQPLKCSITMWFGNSTAQQKKQLDVIVHSASECMGYELTIISGSCMLV